MSLGTACGLLNHATRSRRGREELMRTSGHAGFAFSGRDGLQFGAEATCDLRDVHLRGDPGLLPVSEGPLRRRPFHRPADP